MVDYGPLAWIASLLAPQPVASWMNTGKRSLAVSPDASGLYLHREPPAVDAVLRTFRTVARAPVELHLLCLEPAWEPSPTDEVVVLQHDGHWKRRRTEDTLRTTQS